MVRSTLRLSILVLILVASCGKKDGGAGKAKEDAPSGPQAAPLIAPMSGVDSIKRMNYVYGDGRSAYDKAIAAYKAKERDWATVRAQSETAVAKDPFHFEAQYLLARALAQAGEHAAVVDHLVTALASDYFRFGPTLAADPDLKEFLATQHGQAVTAVAAKIGADYKKRVPTAVWLIARRSSFKWPRDAGVQPATTRGEIYAYDRETKRYFQLTHTNHRVAGFVRSASGSEAAVLGFDKVDRPKAEDQPPLLPGAWVQLLETTDWQPIGKRITLPAAREISLGYGAGDQLLVATAQAAGRWGITEPIVSSVDKATGKLTKVAAKLPVPRIDLSLDAGRVVRSTDGIEAPWTGDPPTAPTLKAGTATIQVRESGAASQASIALAPGGARLAFATAVDPCSKDASPSLYVADTKTGALKHLLTAKSRFVTRWLDANTLAYEDGDGAIRLWDAASGRQLLEVENKPGIALDVLSLAPAPLCKQAPPVVEPVGTGSGSAEPDEPPLPPEEPPGPVTKPE